MGLSSKERFCFLFMMNIPPKANILNPAIWCVWVDVSPFPFSGIFRFQQQPLEGPKLDSWENSSKSRFGGQKICVFPQVSEGFDFWWVLNIQPQRFSGMVCWFFGGAPNQRMGKKRPQLCRWFYFWSSLTIPILRPPKVSRWPLKPNSFPRNVWWTKPTPQLKQCHGARKNHSITTQN